MITTRRSRILEQRRHHRSRSFLTYDTGRSEGMTSFQTLPIELLNNTSDLLDKNELLNVRLINCRLRQAVEPRIGSLYFKEVRCLISKIVSNDANRPRPASLWLGLSRPYSWASTALRTFPISVFFIHPGWIRLIMWKKKERVPRPA